MKEQFGISLHWVMTGEDLPLTSGEVPQAA
jgi:hypothetical protein